MGLGVGFVTESVCFDWPAPAVVGDGTPCQIAQQRALLSMGWKSLAEQLLGGGCGRGFTLLDQPLEGNFDVVACFDQPE
jgi:hypothetical protein